MRSIGSGAVKLVESTVNVASGYGFSSNETLTDMAKAKGMTLQQYKDWMDYADEQEGRGVIVSETKKIQMRDEFDLALKDNMDKISGNKKRVDEVTKIARTSANKMFSLIGGGESLTHENSTTIRDAVETIINKRRQGEDITSDDASKLMKSMWQAKGQSLSAEIADVIESNRDKFNLPKGDSVQNFADKIANDACVLTTLYGNMLLSSPDGNVPKSFGDFYKTMYDNGFINKADGVSISISQQNYQKMVDSVVGKGVLVVESFSGKNAYIKMEQAFDNDSFLAGVARTKGSLGPHNILLMRNDDGVGAYDTGLPKNTWGPLAGPRPHGVNYERYVDKKNFQSFYYIRKK